MRRSKTVGQRHQCGSDYDSSGRSDGSNYGPQAVCHWSGLENRDRAVSMGAVLLVGSGVDRDLFLGSPESSSPPGL